MFPHRCHATSRSILISAATGALLASCALTGGASDEGPTTITYWSWISGSQQIVDRFNETHDDIQVDFQLIPGGGDGGYSKMFNAVRAGKAPDVVTVEYPQLNSFITQDLLRPITDYGVTELADQYPEWTWEQVAPSGADVYALPKDVAPTVLYYRADLFDEYGLEPPATWDEFRSTAEQLQVLEPEAALTTFGHNDAGLLSGLAWQAGAEWFDTSTGEWKVNTTDEHTVRMARFWDGLIADGLVNAEPQYAEKHITDLQNGRSLTMIGAPWTAANLSRFLPEQAGLWDVAPIPNWGEEATAGNFGGSTMALPKGSPNPDAAIEFARWVSTSPDAVAAAAPVSTAYPANVNLQDTWAQEVSSVNEWVEGMRLPDVTSPAAQEINPAWEWGPDMTESFSRLGDAASSRVGRAGGLEAALRDWQDGTVDQLRLRGYNASD
ncbi:ABC transporter substrate-binding protein [Streptomyces profundus]|uniref:ABC transporter substrate-binding protein n=1 Tax=Streptomyces profundus TaxID=2867410 RepID=UPI001D166B3D|nr:sugar ABC transporter substrate-binding protein [Streptomyces sp. MA3_2.13]UED85792.1 sugar ABC transporter substrate-binding protein [Streptomyces sp. MA3_2.13]